MLRRQYGEHLMAEVYHLVRQVPTGKVVSYGQVGEWMVPPLPALLVGKIMYHAPEEVPWWRVVGKAGDLLIAKRDPRLAALQRQLLQQEGVRFREDGRVDMASCRWQPFEEER
ncbi:MAG: MGMT family protein [bacterium]|nr:MGMT family protein [bacterium]MCS7309414.1 MGMT family protein [Armatimonadota bacterium]